MPELKRMDWSWKNYFLGFLVATIAPQLIGISVVMVFVIGSIIYQSGGMSMPPGMFSGGMGFIGIFLGSAAVMAMFTLPSTLIYAGIISRVFCVKPWTRQPWKAVRFGALLTTIVYFCSAGFLLAVTFGSEATSAKGDVLLRFLLGVGVVWLLALVPGSLTAWILNRFFKILDRRQLLAADSGQSPSPSTASAVSTGSSLADSASSAGSAGSASSD